MNFTHVNVLYWKIYIRERIGYIPVKLTESYIQNLAAKMDESTKKDMVIQQPKPINVSR
jgi:hypothetical protein